MLSLKLKILPFQRLIHGATLDNHKLLNSVVKYFNFSVSSFYGPRSAECNAPFDEIEGDSGGSGISRVWPLSYLSWIR